LSRRDIFFVTDSFFITAKKYGIQFDVSKNNDRKADMRNASLGFSFEMTLVPFLFLRL
jgi:hypothetical protein